MWENVRFSMNSTMPLFFVMLLGYVLYQKKFLSDAFVAGANKFVFYVALPVQLFRDLAATDVRAAFDGAYVLFCFVVTLGSIATPSCYVMAKQMGHEGVLTGSVCVTTTLFSAFSLTFWLFLLRSMGCIA